MRLSSSLIAPSVSIVVKRSFNTSAFLAEAKDQGRRGAGSGRTHGRFNHVLTGGLAARGMGVARGPRALVAKRPPCPRNTERHHQSCLPRQRDPRIQGSGGGHSSGACVASSATVSRASWRGLVPVQARASVTTRVVGGDQGILTTLGDGDALFLKNIKIL